MIGYNFGEDEWAITAALESAKLIPQNDPLVQAEFFPKLGLQLLFANDPASYDAAYAQVVSKLPEELRENMPAGFDRKVLLALCHDKEFLIEWARQHFDFPVLAQCGGGLALISFLLWPPYWWPINLCFYVPLGLGFIGAALVAVFGPQMEAPIIQFGFLLFYLGFMAAIAAFVLYVLSLFIEAFVFLIRWLLVGINWAGDLGRLKTIEKTRARLERRKEKAAAAAAGKK